MSRIQTLRHWIWRRPRRGVAIVAVAVALTGFLAAGYAFHLFGTGTNCWIRPAGPAGSAVFTIVMANEGVNVGYNSSRYHPAPWPVMNVTQGQYVVIHVINNDTQAHGFQIISYFEQGIGAQSGLAPGKCYDVSFTANVLGSFTIRCNTFCTIHSPWMQYGELNVNP